MGNDIYVRRELHRKGRVIPCQEGSGRHPGEGTKILPTQREGTENNARFREGESKWFEIGPLFL